MKRNILYALLFVLFGLQGYFHNTELATVEYEVSPLEANQNTAIFAAYSADGTVPEYVVEYLKTLKKIAPNIIYITDNPIKRNHLKKITPFVKYVSAKRHGEYDWGSYKRGYQYLADKKIKINSEKTPLLIFANDSTIPLTDNFSPILSLFNKTEAPDFIGITANTDGTYHLQSYFLAFTPKVYLRPEFQLYLNGVHKEPDGLTVAYHYEVPFTEYLHKLGFKSEAYIPYESLSHLPLNDKNCYPLTLVSQYHIPFLKMRTFTNRLNVQESRRLLFRFLEKNHKESYELLIKHLKHINSPYLKEAN